jgi:flagellar protein FlaJ
MAAGVLVKLGIKSQPQSDEAETHGGLATLERVDRKQLYTDLFTHISYMASLATAKASRDVMFTMAAKLNLTTTPFFVEINTLVHRLKYDYAEACRAVAERTSQPDVSALLLRLSGSLSSGEDEADFLIREAAVMSELFQAQYERDVESLRKWTDAFSAMMVSAGLIVVVSIISMMIWTLGPGMILATAGVTLIVTAVGTWIIHAAAPSEQFTRKSGLSADGQLRAMALFKLLAPIGVIGGSAVWFLTGNMGIGMIIAGAFLLPGGWLMNRDQKRIAALDNDIAPALRMVGGVTSAIGSTVRDALTKVDRRSLGKLEGYFRRLEVRMNASITPDLCWRRFIKECGSELIERSTNIFWDALTIGGEPGQTGRNAAFFAGQIALLRAKRALVANTFGYLVLPLHAAMSGLLVFIVNVMGLFATSLAQAAPELPDDITAAQDVAAVAGYNTFADLNFGFLNILVTIIIWAFTLANSVAPWGASGGHRLRGLFILGQMMIVAGAMMAIIPPAANAIFSAITAPAR